MARFNWLSASLEPMRGSPEGFDGSYAEIGPVIGGEHLAGSVYEVPPGRKLFPYHWEAAQEEWLLVLSGTPTLRTPEGTRELRAGDLACFVCGAEGAHQVSNGSDAPARILMLSDRLATNVVVYPDSGKVGVRTPALRPNHGLDATLEYWEGEGG